MSDNILNSETTVTEQQAEVQQAEVQATPEVKVESPAATNQVSLQDLVSDEYRAVVEGKGFKDVNDVIKSYSNLERMVGNSVRIPPADASPEARAEFLNKIKDVDGVIVKPMGEESKDEFLTKLGRPESADGYDLQDVVSAELAGRVPSLHAELDDFKKIAHDIGLNQEQAKKLVEMRMSTLKQMDEQQNLVRSESEKVLHQLWGQDFDNRLNAAKQTAKIYSEKHPEAMAELINGPTGNNPALLSMLAELGGTFKEKGHVGMQATSFGLTPGEALSKIADKKADPGFMKAYMDDKHVGHKKAVDEITKLYSIAYDK